MSGETGRVEVVVNGEDELFWLTTFVNGFTVSGSIPVDSIDDGRVKSVSVEALVRDVYRRAYRAGFRDCQCAIKDALGIDKK